MPRVKEPEAPCRSPAEHALVHQPLEHTLEVIGISGHVVARGGNSLLQGGHGHILAGPLVCHSPQDHLGYAGLLAGFGTGALPSRFLARDTLPCWPPLKAVFEVKGTDRDSGEVPFGFSPWGR